MLPTGPACDSSQERRASARLLLVALRDLAPVHDVPPGLDVVRPAVLVLQVVRVLPDVEAEQDVARLRALHERVVLVGRADDRQPVALADEPRPARAEAADARRLELLAELREVAERLTDRLTERAARLAAGVRPHQLPEERV